MGLLVDYSKRRAANPGTNASILGRNAGTIGMINAQERIVSRHNSPDLPTSEGTPTKTTSATKEEAAAPPRRVSRAERNRAAVQAKAAAAKEEQQETQKQAEEMPSLLSNQSSLGGAPSSSKRASRAERRGRKNIEDDKMPLPSSLMAASTGSTNKSAAAGPKFIRCETSELVKEHRNRRPTVLAELEIDTSDMDMSMSNRGDDNDDDDDDSIDLLAPEPEPEQDWSKPSRTTVNKAARISEESLVKRKPIRRRMLRSASDNQMHASLSSITEAKDEEVETSANRHQAMMESRCAQSMSNVFAKDTSKNRKNRPGLKKDISFTLRRQKISRCKSLDESICSVSRLEFSLSNIAVDMTKDASDDSNNHGPAADRPKPKPRPRINRVRSMDASFSMSMSNLDCAMEAPPLKVLGFGRRDSKFGFYDGPPPEAAEPILNQKRNSDPTSCHTHGVGGCKHCNRRNMFSKSNSVSQLMMSASFALHPEQESKRFSGGKCHESSSPPASGGRRGLSKTCTDDKATDNVPTNISVDMVSFQATEDSKSRKKEEAFPSMDDLGYGEEEPISSSSKEGRSNLLPGSLSGDDYSDTSDAAPTAVQNARQTSLRRSRQGHGHGHGHHHSRRRASSMSMITQTELSDSSGGRPSASSRRHQFRNSSGEGSRRNLMGDKNKKADCSGFVTGSRIRRIADPSQLLKRSYV